MNPKKFISLTDDKMFRYVFSDSQIAEGMINLYLDYIGKNKKVKAITSNSDYCIMGEDIFAKESYSDVITFLDNDEKYSLEMYTSFGVVPMKKS